MRRMLLLNRIKIVPKICSLVGMLTSASMLFIWLAIPELKSFSAVSMKANTAVGILFASLSLYALKNLSKETSKSKRTLGYIFGLISLLIGLTTLSQYTFGINIGIDELLVSDFNNLESRLFPGRMSPIAAVSLILVSLGLLFINIEKGVKFRASSYFVITLLLISKLALIGYILGENSFYQLGPYIRISWPSALCFYFLSIGILWSRPENDPVSILASSGLGGETARRLLPVVIIAPLAFGWLINEGNNFGFFDLDFGFAILIVGLIVILMGMVNVTAKKLDALELKGIQLSLSEQHTKERFMEVLNHTPLIVWALDQEGCYTLSEGKALHGLGLSPSELVGKNHSEVHKNSLSAQLHVKRAFRGETFTGQVEIDGRIFSTNYVPSLNSLGMIIGISAVSTDITEQTVANRALIQSQNQLRDILNQTDAVIYLKDLNGKNIFANKALELIHGSLAENIIGKTDHELFDKDIADQFVANDKMTLESATSLKIEEQVRVDNDLRTFITNKFPLFDVHGQIYALCGISTEITDQKSAERQVVDILESMSDAFFSIDNDWKITRVNAQHEKITKIQRAEQIGQNLLDLFFSDPKFRHSEYLKAYRKAMKERCFVKFEDFYSPLNLWTEVRVYPQSEGGLAVFFTDITERKRQEISLVLERQKLDLLIAESSSAIGLMKGKDLVFELVNKKWTELVSAREYNGRRYIDVYPELIGTSAHESHVRVFETGEPFVAHEMKLTVTSSSGILEDQYFDYTNIRILDTDGKPYGIYCNAVNVTERVQSRKALEKSKRDAEMATELKSSFLANMSHEIRTPLGAILGFTDLLKDEAIQQEDRTKYLNTISRNGKALTRIIDDILDLAKVESGRLEIELIEFSFFSLIDEVVDLFRERTLAKSIFLKTRIERNVPDRIISDPTRLRQILINIVGNAVKFTSQGGCIIDITGEQTEKNGFAFLLEVKDSGLGIDGDQISKLFSPFVQADNTTTRNFGGTGLGLALSKRLANALNGDVAIKESTFGEGTTIAITFAASIPEAPQTWELHHSDVILKVDSLNGARILVADDSSDNLIYIQSILAKQGATVETAVNGREAFKSCMRGKFDIVLMDIQMPVMDGYEATRALREAGYQKPIIALTAHAMAEERARSLAAGCNLHITKPINGVELVGAILRVITEFENSRRFKI